uniref:Uncharacterized protein n=1 Tax=Quercus lobata TaxID=97700 RepID=A0A7N2M6C4_QUELO
MPRARLGCYLLWFSCLHLVIKMASLYDLFHTWKIPFSVVLGWIMEQPMDLNFQLFETATLFIFVFIVALMLQEGTHYFKGLMLLLCYLIVAASFFVHVDVSPGVQLKFHFV